MRRKSIAWPANPGPHHDKAAEKFKKSATSS
jgi:hypothetical protein